MELIVKYYAEDKEVHIEDYHYNSCTYCNIESAKQVGECVEDFIKSYCEEEDK